MIFFIGVVVSFVGPDGRGAWYLDAVRCAREGSSAADHNFTASRLTAVSLWSPSLYVKFRDRILSPGRPLRLSHAEEVSRVCRGCDSHSRTRHWSQHNDFLCCGWRAAEPTSLS